MCELGRGQEVDLRGRGRPRAAGCVPEVLMDRSAPDLHASLRTPPPKPPTHPQ